jgi:hypothetical protein
MEHRLGYTIEEQAYSHSSGEEHGKPTEGTEIRFSIVPSKPYIPIPTEHQIEHEYQDNVHCQGEKPTGVGGNPVEKRVEYIPQHLVEKYRYNDKSYDLKSGQFFSL